jgi:hypothetical protein
MFWSMKKTTAGLLVVAAIAAPAAANARPLDPVRPPVVTQNATDPDPSPIVAPKTSSGGFDWADAGIGAATVLTVIGLGAGTALVVRRARERRPATN